MNDFVLLRLTETHAHTAPNQLTNPTNSLNLVRPIEAIRSLSLQIQRNGKLISFENLLTLVCLIIPSSTPVMTGDLPGNMF